MGSSYIQDLFICDVEDKKSAENERLLWHQSCCLSRLTVKAFGNVFFKCIFNSKCVWVEWRRLAGWLAGGGSPTHLCAVQPLTWSGPHGRGWLAGAVIQISRNRMKFPFKDIRHSPERKSSLHTVMQLSWVGVDGCVCVDVRLCGR